MPNSDHQLPDANLLSASPRREEEPEKEILRKRDIINRTLRKAGIAVTLLPPPPTGNEADGGAAPEPPRSRRGRGEVQRPLAGSSSMRNSVTVILPGPISRISGFISPASFSSLKS